MDVMFQHHDPEAFEQEYSKDSYSIFQLKQGEEYCDLRFEPFDRLQATGHKVQIESYDLVYHAPLSEQDTLEGIYTKFNIDHPEDFKGHSLSVSDIVVLHQNGKDTAHYCDSFGFTEVPEFLKQQEQQLFKYYSTQRPVDISTYPKAGNEPTNIVNFDTRQPVESGTIQAWGYLEYPQPLTEHQLADYELKASPSNYLENAEKSVEQNFNQIDGIINNEPAPEQSTDTDRKPSIKERLKDTKRECNSHKEPKAPKIVKQEPEL